MTRRPPHFGLTETHRDEIGLDSHGNISAQHAIYLDDEDDEDDDKVYYITASDCISPNTTSDDVDNVELFTGNMPIRTPALPENVASLHGQALRHTGRDLKSVVVRGVDYCIGECVELLHPSGEPRAGDFLRIHQIKKDWYGSTCKLRGLLMRRQSKSDGFLDRRLNELYMVLQTNPEFQGSDFERGLVEVDFTQVLCKRQIILTNVQVTPLCNPHADLSFRGDHQLPGETKNDVRNNRVLVCRWASVISATTRQLARGRAQQESLRRLQEDELRELNARIPGNIRICENYLLYTQWRGLPDNHSVGCHTTLDAFCASGQISEAFSEAGFSIMCGFDMCPEAIATYQLNRSHETICLNYDVFQFAAVAAAYTCDHLHTSFVCKTHSSLHTHAGKDDDANEATLFSTDVLVGKTRPRIVTVENVAGLATHNKDKKMLQKAVNALTSLNYSVAWTLVDMRDYGLAARRRRIIMVASCPGAAPPAFPKPTHGPPGSGLLPFNTVGNVLASIPEWATHQGTEHSKVVNKKPYDCFRSVNCITTNGGDPGINYHPSGRRTLNVRELASLNGFRPDFILPESRAKALEMIGNAVPRTAFRPFAEKIRQYLQKQDDWLARESARVYYVD